MDLLDGQPVGLGFRLSHDLKHPPRPLLHPGTGVHAVDDRADIRQVAVNVGMGVGMSVYMVVIVTMLVGVCMHMLVTMLILVTMLLVMTMSVLVTMLMSVSMLMPVTMLILMSMLMAMLVPVSLQVHIKIIRIQPAGHLPSKVQVIAVHLHTV